MRVAIIGDTVTESAENLIQPWPPEPPDASDARESPLSQAMTSARVAAAERLRTTLASSGADAGVGLDFQMVTIAVPHGLHLVVTASATPCRLRPVEVTVAEQSNTGSTWSIGVGFVDLS